ncbi:MAG TPA: nitroreductase family protein [Deltaproteobacteria bacterium]|nr:nitroreductase family protein [Deltaproteobacteria bacterium]
MKDVDFRELIVKRRSIREFEQRPVEVDVVRQVISDSVMAPSARNAQPWSFSVVMDKDLIRRLSDESKRNILWDMDQNPTSTYGAYRAVLEDANFHVFYNAPCVVYISGPKDVRSIQVDCALAGAYFMLAAADRGLGTCWVDLGSAIRDKALRRELGLGDDRVIVATLAVGYPKTIPEAPPRAQPRILRIVE